MSRRLDAPGIESILRNHGDDIRELKRVPGRWIYVGTYPADPDTTPESPPFQNGWDNAGGGFARLSFFIDKWQKVHLRGGVEGGAVGTVITTLPLEYRPPQSERFAVAGASGAAVIQIDPNGDVTHVF